MEELKIIYEIIATVWQLCKKYGSQRLNDAQWEAFVGDADTRREQFCRKGKEYDLLFRGMFAALQEYYIRKERLNEKEIV